jgi:16S rRNA (cytidine1402-2'-O)-methyltransferase
MAGKLYLIPSTIGIVPPKEVIPEYVLSIVNHIKCYIVEDERTGRRTLLSYGIQTPINELVFFVLNKHTHVKDLTDFIENASKNDIGLLSEAGVPAIADPGSDVVLLAHRYDMEIIPLVGPSSILMAMMASGLNGQNFAFNGYLPIRSQERIKKLKQLEQRSHSENQSQIFIETPYRNNQLLADILNTCSKNTLLCIATDITSKQASIKTRSITEWRTMSMQINKRPTIFILHKK